MKAITTALLAFHADDSGAAFIEYTALLGVILAVGLSVLTAIGNWAYDIWNSLSAGLGLN